MTLHGAWAVESLAIGGELQPPLTGPVLTLEVDGHRVSGFAGVNRFSGDLRGRGALIGPLATTRRAGPHALMAQEDIYLRHLREADSFEVSHGGISLLLKGLITVTLLPARSDPGTSQWQHLLG